MHYLAMYGMKQKIKEVLKRGTTIEVFLGEEDKIIDSKETHHIL